MYAGGHLNDLVRLEKVGAKKLLFSFPVIWFIDN